MSSTDDDYRSVVSDDLIQQFLDEFRLDVVFYPLLSVQSVEAGTGIIQIRQYYSDWHNWETDVVFQSSEDRYAYVTPSESDLFKGMWWFDQDYYDMYITGKSHCLYSAGAAVARYLSGATVWEMNFSGPGGSVFQKGELMTRFQTLARELEKKARPHRAELIRGDVRV